MNLTLPTHSSGTARGFTLVEMILSMTILSLIFGVCMSVIILSTRARGTESATELTAQTITTRATIDGIAAELKSAINISSRSANSISFTIPDRDGDGDPESISYYKLGNDLMRSYNSIFPTTYLRDIGSISFDFLDKTTATVVPVESAEQLLMSYTTLSTATTALTSNVWECQYFNPVAIMPAKALSWKITRVQFLLRKASSGSTGSVIVQMRPAAATFKPLPGAMSSVTVAVSSISTSNTWVEFPLATPLGELSPSQGVAMVISSTTSSSNATINGKISISPAVANTAECETANAGSTWSTPDGTASMNFRVYGTITTLP